MDQIGANEATGRLEQIGQEVGGRRDATYMKTRIRSLEEGPVQLLRGARNWEEGKEVVEGRVPTLKPLSR